MSIADLFYKRASDESVEISLIDNLDKPNGPQVYADFLEERGRETPSRGAQPFPWLIIRAVAHNLDTPPRILHHIATTEQRWLTWATVARNPIATDETLAHLVRIEDDRVANLAAEQLHERERFDLLPEQYQVKEEYDHCVQCGADTRDPYNQSLGYPELCADCAEER